MRRSSNPKGRPINSGKYGEPTVVVRVPITLVEQAKAWINKKMGVKS